MTGDRLVNLMAPQDAVPPLAHLVHDPLRAMILGEGFACVGAKAALQQGTYRLGVFADLGTEAAAARLARGLELFAGERDAWKTTYSTYIAAFMGPTPMAEADFEAALWRQLQLLHELDRSPWDTAVSDDPSDPAFSFSFAGEAFFIVGMHPASSRWTRRFAWPLLVFNPHEQFDTLREDGAMTRMQEAIRERDRDLQGTTNPNLSDFGEMPEARQYSGRAAGPGWKCPFHT